MVGPAHLRHQQHLALVDEFIGAVGVMVQDGPKPMHIYPENDTRVHEQEGGECWCNPRLERDGAGLAVVMVLHQRAAYWESDDIRPPDAPMLHGAN